MRYRNIKFITALWQNGVESVALDALNTAINQFLRLAGVLSEYRRTYSYNHGIGYFWLLPINPINTNAYIRKGWEESTEKDLLNSSAILNAMISDPNRTTQSRYDLILVKERLHWKSDSSRSVAGVGLKDKGAVVTYAHLNTFLQPATDTEVESWEDRKKRKAIFSMFVQMTFMHELGHVAGLFPNTGPANPTDEELKNMHCLNDCVMFWRHSEELFNKIKTRSDAEGHKKLNPFCPDCLAKLREFFIEP